MEHWGSAEHWGSSEPSMRNTAVNKTLIPDVALQLSRYAWVRRETNVIILFICLLISHTSRNSG